MKVYSVNLQQMDKTLEDAFSVLNEESRDLFLPRNIPELFEIPSAMEFLRDNVSKNIPLVIREGCKWPCIEKWSSQYFRQTMAYKPVKVALTPNGYADGIAEWKGIEYFVMPEEKIMPMEQFLDNLLNKSTPVNYIQTQNNNLIHDFPELLADIDDSMLNFAKEAFNKSPDAANFWMGDERAVTSMHKDPYENIYIVVSGYKDFILIPPTDVPNVPRKKYQSAIYKTNKNGVMDIEPIFDDNKKPIVLEWVSIDPLKPDLEEYPAYEEAIKYEIRLNPGDILYLPSLWYHHVRQSHKNISLNFWYDMDYDARYCYYKMVEKLCGYGG
uniref:CSON013302 protein n=3 Tax=Culicoides sonorensis TaxID=179676 RepID=A0A336KNJ7_CULSO